MIFVQKRIDLDKNAGKTVLAGSGESFSDGRSSERRKVKNV